MLRAFVDESGAQLRGDLVDVDALQELANGRSADVGEESVVTLFLCLLLQVEITILVEQLVLRDFLLSRIDDDVVRVVHDLLEVAQRQVHEVPHRTRKSLEEPDVGDGNGELDVTHALATDASKGDFDAAAVADDSAITDSLVLAAVTLPILHWSEDPLAEEAILLRLEGAVVDGLGLQYLAPRPPRAETRHLESLALLWILGSAHLLG